ncbi:MAG TPA: DNA-formamidopyrimidine glycosylase family protein, partial [Candidatus Pacearchaeota archaeon]|nr:DNA-formamidopyrimidine glycosylase family protein [Candidatus Pacearchaeota archaeon]
IVSQLKTKVLQRAFVGVWSDAKSLVKGQSFESFAAQVKGRKILRVERLGKNILFHLSSGKIILLHLKMTGHLLWGKWEKIGNKWVAIGKGPLRDDWTNQFIHVMFFLDKGAMLALTDIRKFAKLEIFDGNDLLEKKELQIGPDPLSVKFTYPIFKAALMRKPNGKIKQVLMDQAVVAGIGNIYSDEILWEARVNPFTMVKNIHEGKLKEIYKFTKTVLAKGVRLKGESFSDYRDLYGQKGDFDRERKAYKRESHPCFRCHTLLVSKKIGGRTTRFCPKCQKL